MNGKAYEVITSSIKDALQHLQELHNEDEAITFEDAISELISTLEERMRREGMPTSNLWRDCGF